MNNLEASIASIMPALISLRRHLHAHPEPAFHGQRTPIVIWRLGVTRPGAEPIPLHSPRFDFADDAIAMGVRMHCALALRFHEFHRRMHT